MKIGLMRASMVKKFKEDNITSSAIIINIVKGNLYDHQRDNYNIITDV